MEQYRQLIDFSEKFVVCKVDFADLYFVSAKLITHFTNSTFLSLHKAL